MGDAELLRDIGTRIYKKRKALCMTQEQLAEKINVSVQMISNLESEKKQSGRRTLSKYVKLSISVQTIFFSDTQEKRITMILLNYLSIYLKVINP